jgi:hypothetical protein
VHSRKNDGLRIVVPGGGRQRLRSLVVRKPGPSVKLAMSFVQMLCHVSFASRARFS